MLDIILNTVSTVSSAIGWANERSQRLAKEEKELEIKEKQLEIKCLYSALAKIAKADGSVTKNSINVIKKIFTRYSYTEEQQGLCILYFNEAKNKPLTIKTYAVELAKLVNTKCNREVDSALDKYEGINEYIKCTEYYLGEIMNLFCEVAVADGQPSHNKLHLLKEVEESFKSVVMKYYNDMKDLIKDFLREKSGEISGENAKVISEAMLKLEHNEMSREMAKQFAEVLLKLEHNEEVSQKRVKEDSDGFLKVQDMKFKHENIFKGLVEKCLRNQMNQDADF